MTEEVIALVGNPNTGKTSLFNALTHSYEYVGNWTGVTVEKKIGQLHHYPGKLIDLPGIYSLQPMSQDESVAVSYLLHERPDALLNIVDASQLERNLYLTIQLLEYGVPIYMALNMNDVAKRRGIHIDVRNLSKALHVPVFTVNARRKQGIATVIQHLGSNINPSDKLILDKLLDYGEATERTVAQLSKYLPSQVGVPTRWIALQYMEQNERVRKWVHAELREEISEHIQRLSAQTEQLLQQQGTALHLAQHIRSVRTAFIRKICKEVVTCSPKAKGTATITGRIDSIVTNRWLGIPIFLSILFLMFKATFEWIGTPLSDALKNWISGPFTAWISFLLHAMGMSPFTHALLEEGIVAGVGGVLVFIPQIFTLFLFIAFIEDSGYMARVTMVMDRLMEAVGLNGKAFIPFVIGFGCNVPGIMAARTIEQPRERLVTILLVPLMSCSARLSVYGLFTNVFFKNHQALIVLSLYVMGITLSLLLAKLFTKRIMKVDYSIFVVELPPYHLPQWQTLFRSTWEKGKGFVRKAGTFILGGSVLIWLLTYIGPSGYNIDINDSFLAMIGGVIAPLFIPLGFATWQAGAALITGFLAKEVVISTMNIVYHAPGSTLLEMQIAQSFTPLSAYTFCAFVLLYVPCLATVGIIKKEVASWRWTLFSVGYSFVIAYIVALLITGIGKWLGYP